MIFGGTQGDTTNLLPAAQVAGKIVLVRPGQQGAGGNSRGGRGAAGGRGAFVPPPNPFAGAAAVVTIGGDVLGNGGGGRGGRGGGGQVLLNDTIDIDGKAAYNAARIPDYHRSWPCACRRLAARRLSW